NGVVMAIGAMGNSVAGNLIGTDATGTIAMGNTGTGTGFGVGVFTGAAYNNIGGATRLGSKTIPFTKLCVRHPSDPTQGTPDNPILINSIYGNTKLGIDLGDDGVTPNHSGGTIAGTPNGLQNYPVLSTATFLPGTSSGAGTTLVSGSLNAGPNSTYLIQFFA